MNFDLTKIIRREDGSYVVNNGMYHVPNEGEWSDLWQQVNEYAKEHPEVVEHEPAHPEPTEEEKNAQLQAHLTSVVQNVLDEEAKKLGYDSCLSVCSYIDTGVQKFDDEGRAFRKWRSEVWSKGYEILDEVLAGTREIPTEEELLAELPKLTIVYTN